MFQKSLFLFGVIALTYALFIFFFNSNSMLHYYKQQEELKVMNRKLQNIEKKNEDLDTYLKTNPNKTTKDILLELGYVDKDEVVVDLKIPPLPATTPTSSPVPFLSPSASIFVFFFGLFLVIGLIFRYQLRRNPPIKPELSDKLKLPDNPIGK